MPSRRDDLVAGFVVAIGLIQIAGFVTRITPLQNLGAATAASPLPLVFTDRGGYEDFAADFELELRLADGQIVTTPITPKLFARIPGPDDRRYVYGTVATFAPFLGDGVWNAVMGHGFCGNGPLARGLELTERVDSLTLRIATKTEERPFRSERRLRCPR